MQKKKIPLVILFCGWLAALPLLTCLLPAEDFSEREKRYLQKAPDLSLRSLLKGDFMEQTEDYMADHYPAREAMVGLSAYFDLFTGRNGSRDVYLGRDGWLFPKPVHPDNQDYAKNLAALRQFAETCGRPVSLMAVPTAGGVVTDKLPAVHLPYEDGELLQTARQALAGAVEWIDLYGLFEARQDEGLYYRTDHHWTSRGAYLAYEAFGQARGWEPLPEEAFGVTSHGGFYGTSYAKSGYWAVEPDALEIWENSDLQARVSIYDDNRTEPIESDSLFFTGHLEEGDQYPVFLDGNHSLVRIENPAAEGGRLLVVKDSFAHCLVPFLSAHYSRIDMIDLRYFKRQTVTDYLAENPCDEVLLVYGLESLATDNSLRFLADD